MMSKSAPVRTTERPAALVAACVAGAARAAECRAVHVQCQCTVQSREPGQARSVPGIGGMFSLVFEYRIGLIRWDISRDCRG